MQRRPRADRFREIRDEVMKRIAPRDGQIMMLHCGPFQIMVCPPGTLGYNRGFNFQIWPGGRSDHGIVLYEGKVANVDWDLQDRVSINSYRSGPWEGELLARLRAGEPVVHEECRQVA